MESDRQRCTWRPAKPIDSEKRRQCPLRPAGVCDAERLRCTKPNPHSWGPAPDHDGSLQAGLCLFAAVSATAALVAVGQLRRPMSWFYSQLGRVEMHSTWEEMPRKRSRTGEAWNWYNRRMYHEFADERERVERIRRMQRVFNEERHKYKKSGAQSANASYGHQQFSQNNWHWNADSHFAGHKTNYRSAPIEHENFALSYHYSVLGLDRSRVEPFSDAEIKTAFRRKVKLHHPDQNQADKDSAEAKFKQVMISYEAIMLERNKGTNRS